ncbi:uncharacterized protein Dana_GF27945, isoform A [Drosophila ananassae]|uniref:Uncharacterized protein, isoform A n=1 Tax=Drosophila ananassae TaxID=7217 RepID=A0A0P8ZHZ8_DROAN|nr:uncharacterized protein Dana_GF27945, isoform A [Drosophila ananassae]
MMWLHMRRLMILRKSFLLRRSRTNGTCSPLSIWHSRSTRIKPTINFIRDNDQTEYAFKDLLEDLDVSSSDDSDEFDEYDDHYAYVINQKGSRGLFFHNLMYGEIS